MLRIGFALNRLLLMLATCGLLAAAVPRGASAAAFSVTINPMSLQTPATVGQPDTCTVSATLSGQNAANQECTFNNVTWSWGLSIAQWNGSGWTAANPAPTVSWSPAQQTSNPTSLSITFNANGNYQLTFTATARFDSPNCGGNGLSASGSGSANCPAGNAPDFGLSVSPASTTIKIEDNKAITVTGTSINHFYGTVYESAGYDTSLNTSFTNRSLPIPQDGSTSDTLTVSVPSTATAGNHTINVNGEYTGGGSAGPPISHFAPLAVFIPSRYVEIDGPWGPPAAANYAKDLSGNPLPNNRSSDGAITVDTLMGIYVDPVSGSFMFSSNPTLQAKTTNPDGTDGFKSSKEYKWTCGGDMTPNTSTAGYFQQTYQSSYQSISPFLVSPSFYPSSNSFSVNARNMGGTKVNSNSYSVRWHRRLETDGYPAPTVTRDYNDGLIQCGATPQLQIDGASESVTVPGSADNSIAYLGSGFMAVGSALSGNVWAAAFAAGAGVAASYVIGNNTTTFTESMSTWNDAVNATRTDAAQNPPASADYRTDRPDIFLGTTPNPLNNSLVEHEFKFTAMLKVDYQLYHYTGAHWEANGYQGIGTSDVKQATGSGLVAYYTFTKLNN